MELLKNEKSQCFILVLVLLLLGILAQLGSHSFMYHKTNEILKPLSSADSLQYVNFKLTINDSLPKLKTLKSQYETAQEIKSYFMNVALTYYLNYYAFSICSIIFTTLLSIAVFLVANKGWQTSPLILKTFLMTTVVLSSIYYFLPTVLSNKDNIQKNLNKVIVYQKIQSDILSFSSTYNPTDDCKTDTILKSNYDKIVSNFDFIITIDDSKLSSNLQDQLGKLNK